MSRCEGGRNYLKVEGFAVVFWPRGVTKEMTQMVYNIFYNPIPCIKVRGKEPSRSSISVW
jgi:hypothetical protein